MFLQHIICGYKKVADCLLYSSITDTRNNQLSNGCLLGGAHVPPPLGVWRVCFRLAHNARRCHKNEADCHSNLCDELVICCILWAICLEQNVDKL